MNLCSAFLFWLLVRHNGGVGRSSANRSVPKKYIQKILRPSTTSPDSPKAKISGIKTLAAMTEEAQADALPEVDDEWDPFEEN